MEPSEAEVLIDHVRSWASTREDIRALLLVGSFARGDARPDSDLDIVLITSNEDGYLDDTQWVSTFGSVRSIQREEYPPTTSVRVAYEGGIEVEFGIAPRTWASPPFDAGTKRVASNGIRVLLDREGQATQLADAVNQVRFEEPHFGLRDSYRSLIQEFVDRGEQLVPFPLTFANDDFPAFLDSLQKCSIGEGPAAGFVPNSTYWLVADGEVVAVSNLRHRLTDSLRREGGHIGYGVRPSARRRGFATETLKRTLERAKDLGLSEVLITCGKENQASVKTILNNDGVFESEEFLPERDEIVQRYRIPLRTKP